MRKALYVLLVPALTLPAVRAQGQEAKAAPTAQIERGRELFTNTKKGVACKTCHQLGGIGTAIAPDLTNMASNGSVHSIVLTMHMTMTEHVYRVKTAVNSFPGILKQKYGDRVEYYDLSQIPPVVRTLALKEIVSTERDEKWHHPPALAHYSAQELADIIAFLKFASTGSQQEIAVADVDPNW
jgi:mono/diheme cytochrome c family protein